MKKAKRRARAAAREIGYLGIVLVTLAIHAIFGNRAAGPELEGAQ